MTGAARRKAEEDCSDERSIRPRMSPVAALFEPCRMTLKMSANRGRPEVSGAVMLLTGTDSVWSEGPQS